MHPIALLLVVAASLSGGAESGARGLAPSLSQPGPESQGKSPFAGTWVENKAKSNRHPNQRIQTVTLEVTVVGNKVTITRSGVKAGGQKESDTLVLEADGEEHPVSEPPGIVVVTSWSGPLLLHAVARDVGAILGETEYRVSTDGKTLTVTASGTDESGTPFYRVSVFDRKQE